MKLADFDYDMPPELIAQMPADRRDSSRLLVLDKKTGEISHRHFFDILEYITPKDMMVLNDSKVFPARLLGHKETTGGKIEILLNNQINEYDWQVVGKGLKVNARLRFDNSPLSAVAISKNDDSYVVRFNMSSEKFFSELEKIGHVPLPPYIKRKVKCQMSKVKSLDEDLIDRERYQTVYAKERGSVAAPTAGLHFTEELLDRVKRKGVGVEFLTLHVGLGTFAPVKTEKITDHKMHKEYYTISQDVINKIIETKKHGGRIIAVGTTTCRVLETIFQNTEYRIHNTAKIESNNDPESCNLKAESCISGWTDIFIYPPYQFQCVDALITNFHLTKSTLLMLVSAMAGSKNIKGAYTEAIKEHYRFFSYGDAMLII